MKQKSLQSQQQLEKLYGQQQNFFYENISTKLKIYAENHEKTEKLFFDIEENKNLSIEQFELLGCFSYLIGIDYTNQVQLTEEICTKVAKRFADFKFSEEFLKKLTDTFNYVSEKNIFQAKENLKNQFLKIIPIHIEDRMAYNNMRGIIKSIFNNSIIPVNMSVAISDMLAKKDYTYEDIVKLNSAINIQCKFIGKNAVKNVIKLYSDKIWIDCLETAMKLFDNQKFTVIYFDGILSIVESKKKFPDLLFEVITGKSIDFQNLPLFEISTEKVVVETPIEEISTHVKYEKVSDEEMAKISANKPVEFIHHVFCDALHYIPETTEDIFKAIDILFKENDYIQHIYHYMKKQAPLVKVGDIFPSTNINIVNAFDEKIVSLREEYKKSTEIICGEIPQENVQRIIEYINICVGDLILATDDQKQYLISQMIESNISTYQHLMQIVELIENCDIMGNQMLSYVALHKYLEDKNEIGEIFKLSEKNQENHTQLSIYMGFKDFFSLSVKVEEIPETNQEQPK